MILHFNFQKKIFFTMQIHLQSMRTGTTVKCTIIIKHEHFDGKTHSFIILPV